MPRSHDSLPKPTPSLALVALGLVFRFNPAWVAVDLQTAAAEVGASPQWLSRLVTRGLEPFEALVARLTRRGRPPRAAAEDADGSELALTRELLAEATRMLAALPLQRLAASVREHLLGAFERLQRSHQLTQARFCAALGIPTRTFRHWRSQGRVAPAAKPAPRPPPPRKPRQRPPRRGRFGFDVMLPGVQFAADTTDLAACGVQLKLVAAQDVGGRDEALFDSIIVDDHESADLVVQVLDEALSDADGAQLLTDQGTPYLAALTREALAALDVEHAPQKEGDPTGKATIERAFRTVKDLARPLLDVTNRVASAVPKLACPKLARAVSTLVLTALLRAYQHGGRAARAAVAARGTTDLAELARRAEDSREQARATDRSARLLLEHVHQLYALPGTVQAFVNAFRRYPLVVLQDAERALRSQVHRDDIRDRRSYFGAIVRNLHDEHRKRRRHEQSAREQRAVLAKQHHAHACQRAAFEANPAAWLRHALDLIAMQWLPQVGELLFGGVGLGSGHLQAALEHIVSQQGTLAATDLARGVLHDFRLRNADRLGPAGLDALTTLVEAALETLPANLDCAARSAPAMLARTGHLSRPPPPNRLRI